MKVRRRINASRDYPGLIEVEESGKLFVIFGTDKEADARDALKRQALASTKGH